VHDRLSLEKQKRLLRSLSRIQLSKYFKSDFLLILCLIFNFINLILFIYIELCVEFIKHCNSMKCVDIIC